MSRPVITVTRKLTGAVEERLKQVFDTRLNDDDRPMTPAELRIALQQSDALVCTVSDMLSADILGTENRRANMIANVGVGYSNIDTTFAAAQGIVVTNTPDVLTEATADLAWLLILSATRKAFAAETKLRSGNWRGFSIVDGLGMSLQGKSLGIVGMGRIGQAVARRAVCGFGMRVVYFNRSPVPALDFEASAIPDIQGVMSEADIISLHIPGTPGAGPVITNGLLDKMKPGAYIVNTSRGDVVDQAGLVERLTDGRIAGAGLDVYEHEPDVPDTLKSLTNVTLFPHIGSAVLEVRDAMGMLAIDCLVAHFGDGNYPSRVA